MVFYTESEEIYNKLKAMLPNGEIVCQHSIHLPNDVYVTESDDYSDNFVNYCTGNNPEPAPKYCTSLREDMRKYCVDNNVDPLLLWRDVAQSAPRSAGDEKETVIQLIYANWSMYKHLHNL